MRQTSVLDRYVYRHEPTRDMDGITYFRKHVKGIVERIPSTVREHINSTEDMTIRISSQILPLRPGSATGIQYPCDLILKHRSVLLGVIPLATMPLEVEDFNNLVDVMVRLLKDEGMT